MLENLDREKYELFLYATSPEEDTSVRKRIEEASVNFRCLSPLTLVKKATVIHRDKLDLLIDLGGFSVATMQSFWLFARLQCRLTIWGTHPLWVRALWII